MNALMNPILPAVTSQMPAEKKFMEDKATGSSFSEYVERNLHAERREEKNFLGNKARKAREAAASDSATRNKREMNNSEKTDDSSVAGLLSQFMKELQKIAEETETSPGDWTLNLLETDLLQKTAADAGMDENGLAMLLQQMESQDGKIDVSEFLATLSRHFEELQNIDAVTVPETDLPLLQILLSRMGLSQEEITQISDQAVTGDNQLDLAKFLQGLEDVHGENVTSLTDWEVEQLQDILAKAGVSERLQRSLLPERNPFLQNPSEENKVVNLSLTRLQNMLQQGVKEVDAGRLKADLPAFLSDLNEIMLQAGFEQKTAGWTPAVQETIISIYDKLLQSFDMSKMEVVKLEENIGRWFELPEESLLSQFFDEADLTGQDPDLAGSDQQFKSSAQILKTVEQAVSQQAEPAFGHSMDVSASETLASTVEAKPSASTPRMPAQLQQQTFEQITQGVIRGLQGNDHHLVLRLHPRELGEVKVEMLVRDEHIAVSFAMENSKVKDILESKMDQFRDNLEKQGFNLEECMVSVGQHNEPDDAWKRFEFAWKNHQVGVSKTSLADLPEDILYHRSQSKNSSENGIDLFA